MIASDGHGGHVHVVEDLRKLAPETGKARLLTVERLNGGTASWLKEADRILCHGWPKTQCLSIIS